MSDGELTEAQTGRAPIADVFWSFLKIGGSAFGGSTQAMMHREVVERRKWVDDEAFLAGLAISQVLPGANPVNLALYMGMKARGGLGAIVAVTAMIIPAFCIIMLMGFAYRQYSGLPITHFILGGVAAVGIGATLSVGAKVTAKLPRDVITYAIGVAVFVAVGILRLPMLYVVVVAVPVSIGFAWLSARRPN
ncbi:MAG: chromate transporter [Beijerinckiaceae bacterium]